MNDKKRFFGDNLSYCIDVVTIYFSLNVISAKNNDTTNVYLIINHHWTFVS